MDGSDSLREFFGAIGEAFQAGRARLIDQTIEVHGPRARARVAALREKHAEMSDDGIADLLIRDAASRAGSVGAAVAVPGIIPGPGTVVSVALAAPAGPKPATATTRAPTCRRRSRRRSRAGKPAPPARAAPPSRKSRWAGTKDPQRATKSRWSLKSRRGRKRPAYNSVPLTEAQGILLPC